MQRFQFSLETLLALRQAKLEQKEQELAAAISAYNLERQALDANRTSSICTWQHLGKDLAGNLGKSARENSLAEPIPKAEFKRNHADYLYLDRLEKQNRELNEKMHQAHLAMEKEQQSYAEVRRDLRILEKLREKQWQVYQQKLEKHREAAIAEMCQGAAHCRAVREGDSWSTH